MNKSVFSPYEKKKVGYPHRYAATIVVDSMAGGTPSDPRIAEAWIKTKLADTDDIIRGLVAETMLERGVSAEEAAEIVSMNKHLNGFKRDEERGLYYEGRCLKAALKEAVSVAANAGKIPTKGWGNPDDKRYEKGVKAWFPEHAFVDEARLYLGVDKPTGINQRFVQTHHGSGIQLEEYLDDATFDFTIVTDTIIKDEYWAAIWLTLEKQGIGSSRSQGFGTCTVVKWDKVN